MFHPLFKLLASKPELVVSHLAGYAQLVTAQAAGAARGLRTRAVLSIVMGVALLMGFTLAGVALLLFAAVPPAQMNLPWLLVAVPLLPLLVAGAAWSALRSRASEWSLEPLRTQLANDAALLREAGEA